MVVGTKDWPSILPKKHEYVPEEVSFELEYLDSDDAPLDVHRFYGDGHR
jgi:hypothetical protein